MQPLIRRAADRFLTRSPGVETRHGLSFGPHYDPAHVAHGPLVACDEHRLDPGAGFDPHPHRGLEVVSWVLEGVLLHEGPDGTSEVPAGSGQWLSTGSSGITHAERAGDRPTRFVQTWLTSDDPATADERLEAPGDGLAEVGRRGGNVLHVGRVDGPCALPEAAYLLVLVLDGRLRADGEDLHAGDALRLTGGGAVDGAGHVLVWEMHATHPQE